MIRSAWMLAGAAALGQVLQLAALLLLTGIYSPAAFGKLAIATSASAFFAVIVGLQLPFALTSAGGEAQRKSMLWVIQMNTLVSLIIGLPVAVLYADSYALAVLIGAGACLGNAYRR